MGILRMKDPLLEELKQLAMTGEVPKPSGCECLGCGNSVGQMGPGYLVTSDCPECNPEKWKRVFDEILSPALGGPGNE